MTGEETAPQIETRRGYASRQIRDLLFGSLTWPRMGLLMVAASKAIILSIPGDSLSRPMYHYMQALFPESTWLFFLTLYTILGGVCLLGSCERWLRVTTDAYGLALFTAMAVSLSLAMLTLYPIAITLPAQVLLAASAFWIFVRSALDK